MVLQVDSHGWKENKRQTESCYTPPYPLHPLPLSGVLPRTARLSSMYHQGAWRERQKHRLLEEAAGSSGATGADSASHPASPGSVVSLGASPDPMDDGCNHYSIANGNDAPPPPRSPVDGDGATDAVAGAVGANGTSSRVALNVGAAEARSTREERAAKALQTAARVMLARRGPFQVLARETSELLGIRKKSREGLRQSL